MACKPVVQLSASESIFWCHKCLWHQEADYDAETTTKNHGYKATKIGRVDKVNNNMQSVTDFYHITNSSSRALIVSAIIHCDDKSSRYVCNVASYNNVVSWHNKDQSKMIKPGCIITYCETLVVCTQNTAGIHATHAQHCRKLGSKPVAQLIQLWVTKLWWKQSSNVCEVTNASQHTRCTMSCTNELTTGMAVSTLPMLVTESPLRLSLFPPTSAEAADFPFHTHSSLFSTNSLSWSRLFLISL